MNPRTLVVALATLLVAPTAAEAAPKPRAPIDARILAPAEDAFTTAEQVRVRVRVGRTVTGVRVFAGTRDLSGRFKRDGRSFRASLPRTLLGRGRVELIVQTRVGKRAGVTDSVRFTVGRRAPQLATVRSGAGARAAVRRGPAGLRLFSPGPGQLPVAATTRVATTANLTVNGHRVKRRGGGAQREHAWVVSALDGLRTGRNRLRLTVRARDGRYVVKRWSVNRSRALPLAEAGQDRGVRHGRWTKLDGRASQPTQGRRLDYAWRVVTAPKGAKPQLRDASSARPRFRADVPGVYQVALRARHGGGRARAAQAAPAAEDVVTITAAPAPHIMEQGLYVDTNSSVSGLTIAGVTYPLTPTVPQYGGGRFVALNPVTLEPMNTNAAPGGTDGTITIGSWLMPPGAFDPAQAPNSDNYGSALWFGTELIQMISTPREDSAVNFDDISLKGWIQPATQGSTAPPTWITGDQVAYTTRLASSTPTLNEMRIGTEFEIYDGQLPVGATSGFHLLQLDGTGKPIPNVQTVFGFTGDAAADAATLGALLTQLQAARPSPMLGTRYTTFLQSIGKVSIKGILAGVAPLESFALSEAIETVLPLVGGDPDVFSAIDGTQDATGGAYALAGMLGPPSGISVAGENPSPGQVAETSTQLTGHYGSLSGALAKVDGGLYTPMSSDAGAPQAIMAPDRHAFMPALFAAPSAWTTFLGKDGSASPATPAQQAAMQALSGQAVAAKLVPATPACEGASDNIRGAYCELATDWDKVSSDIQALPFDAQDGAEKGYTSADFAAAQTSIAQELLDVQTVRKAIDTYQRLYGDDSGTAIVNAATIAGTIQQQVKSASASTPSRLLGIIEAGLGMAEMIPEVGDVFTFISDSFTLVSALFPDASNDPPLDELQLTQANAAQTVVERYRQASLHLDVYGDYVVSDPVKLQAATQAVDTGVLGLTSLGEQQFEASAIKGTQQFLWGTLLSTAYAVWTGPLGNKNPECTVNEQPAHPFSNIGSGAYWGPPQHGGDDQWWIGIHWGADPYENLAEGNDRGLPSSITTPLFTAPDLSSGDADQAPVGAVMPYFAKTYFQFTALPYPPVRDRGCLFD